MTLSGTVRSQSPGAPWRKAKRAPTGASDAGSTARPPAFGRAVPFLAAGFDAAMIVGIALAMLLVSHISGHPHSSVSVLSTSLVIAAIAVGLGGLRQDYGIAALAAPRGQAERAISAWSVAVGLAAVGRVATGAGTLEVRGTTAAFFVAGLAALPLARVAMSATVRAKVMTGAIAARTVMIVAVETAAGGGGGGITAAGSRVTATAILRDDPTTRHEDLALAVAIARMRRPDDIVLVLPWEDRTLIEQAVTALRQLPAAIHLGAPASLSPSAGPAGVEVVARSLSPFDRGIKRAFDCVVAAAALVVLSPVLLLIAAAIKLDSRGPVLFRQRRYGFNQQPFRILKFRSMTTLEDSATLRQATAGDVRVTRVGRVLRRTSLDELPQLVNVLMGDMSLVGPRPHALAHDRQFERMVALYARRHNVRPGITGWAQVRGYRGETDTSDKIEGRVRHDLDYIDNWSLWFDLTILLRTAFSRQAYRNAR